MKGWGRIFLVWAWIVVWLCSGMEPGTVLGARLQEDVGGEEFTAPVYDWHTFYSAAEAVAVDGEGNIYLAGRTYVNWLGDRGQAPLHPFAGGGSAVAVMKLNADGVYQWHTFYGTMDSINYATDIALDCQGNIYVTGDSLIGGWDVEQPPIHAHSMGPFDLFVLKLNNAGAYQWHTFYGGTLPVGGGLTQGNGIGVDSCTNVYVAGSSTVSWTGDQGQAPRHSFSGGDDWVILKLNSQGGYQWHTFYGSPTGDRVGGIAVDSAGTIVVAGTSWAGWLGYNGKAPLHGYQGGSDIAVLKLNSNGYYLWHTFWGAVSADAGAAVALDESGGVYVTGSSEATWMGSEGRLPVHLHDTAQDLAVLKLSAAGVDQWHTFYGLNGAADSGRGIAVDPFHGVYVIGSSGGGWLGDGEVAPVHAYSGGTEIVALALEGDYGEYRWHTFYGTEGADAGLDAVVDGHNLYLTGHSTASWLGDGEALPLHAFTNLNGDGVAIKLDYRGCSSSSSGGGMPGDGGGTGGLIVP